MRKSFICLALLLAVSLSACGKTTTPTPAKTETGTAGGTTTGGGTAAGGAAAVDAQAIFKQNCVSCHGAELGGGVGPNLQKVGGKLSKDQIASTISAGKGAMPSFKGRLSDADTNALADWLAAKK